ncbi:hypothetical protein NLG97_g6069 [Lecanicillium saksenae]|uniref:Uncharacterized protein n=1 Tax=Lecanicillium saksenae TaxID=468837 RepID=A0ACC1QSB7_9HYPO|nr:hypothetical protein NLG97_g6069 [Lecanicillium saksenae]
MVLHNPNNWHWVNKDVSPWAKQWFEENLLKLEAEEGSAKAKITKIQSMDGDVDVSQRKGKVITIFDVKLVLEYSGSAPDAEDVSGTITVPEVAHDTEEDEYVFDVDVFAESKEKQPVRDLVRTKLVAQLRKEFQKLAPALITEHGRDIQHAAGSNPSSGFSTPKMYNQPGSESKQAPAAATKTSSGGVVNTTTVTDNEEFRAKRGGKFELFGGNVSGEYIELEQNKKVVQKWRLAQWPASHYSTLKIEFDQNDVDHVTVMRVTWDGVPVGQEEVTKRNWLEYYVKSIKTTFGFGTIL